MDVGTGAWLLSGARAPILLCEGLGETAQTPSPGVPLLSLSLSRGLGAQFTKDDLARPCQNF